MGRLVPISGTDPTNPRNAADVLRRLEQIERDTLAMHDETARLLVFAGHVRDVLMGQGLSLAQAQAETTSVTDRIRALRTHLADASDSAGLAATRLHDTKVILSARFEWRPNSGRR